jgi:ABC-type nitrate/sulfonate/bicarbonate transport system substrate-binding protein
VRGNVRRQPVAALAALVAVVALAAVSAGTATGSHSARAASSTVRLAVIPGGGIGLYPQIAIADRENFFKKNGISIQRTDTGTSNDAAQLLITGNVDIATVTPDVAVQAITKGAQLVIVASTANEAPYYIVSRDSYGNPAAFKGKKLGVPQTSGTATFIAEAALAKYGLSDGDYQLIVTGKAPQRLAALTNGAVDATILPAPLHLEAEAQGLKEMLYAGDAIKAPGAVLVATQSFVTSQRPALIRFLTAFLQAGYWSADQKNRTKFLSDIAADSMGQGVAPDALSRTYDEFIVRRHIIPKLGRVGLVNLLHSMQRFHEIDQVPALGRAVDNRYIAQAAKAATPKKATPKKPRKTK